MPYNINTYDIEDTIEYINDNYEKVLNGIKKNDPEYSEEALSCYKKLQEKLEMQTGNRTENHFPICTAYSKTSLVDTISTMRYVHDYYKKVSLDLKESNPKYLEGTLSAYKKLQEKLEKQCEKRDKNHVPVVLGYSKTMLKTIENDAKPIVYKRCLLCGKKIDFTDELYNSIENQIDASKYLEQLYSDRDIDTKYFITQQLFLEMCKGIETDDYLNCLDLFKEYVEAQNKESNYLRK
ncbi:MAG: hypothetical protein E7158_00655 [Firmicutes bacterium]|nr:hypothetical protein [Bacillota bacterium]